MSNPRFPDPFGRRELLEPGATASGGGLSLEQRVAALEQGAASKTRPILYYAKMYLTNAGTPQHTSSGNWQLVGGSGTQPGTWASLCDVRPAGVAAQVDTANKRIYARISGEYLCIGKVSWTSSAADRRVITGLWVDGALADYADGHTSLGPTQFAHQFSSLITMTSGQYLDLRAWQNDSAGEAYEVSASNFQNRLTMIYVGPSV